MAASEPSQETKLVSVVSQEKLNEIDSLMSKALETLRIPGFAVGIVVDGQFATILINRLLVKIRCLQSDLVLKRLRHLH